MRHSASYFIWLAVFLLLFSAFSLYQALQSSLISGDGSSGIKEIDSWCPIPEFEDIQHRSDGLRPSLDFQKPESIELQVKRLSAAVHVPTESWDDNADVDVDPRWKNFDEFHRILKWLFPKVHEVAELQKIHRYGLVFTLKGSSTSAQPIMFMAHQDVVPGGPSEKWTHPPFEPYYDGKYLFGRGSSDCKNNLVGILSTVESLLEQAWRPYRTLILAFGFDEETGGVRGAGSITKVLEDTWGRNGVALIIDEGGMGLTTVGDIVYARPGVAEKGYLDAQLVIEVSGGHSSRPPAHSGIGIMAELITVLERNPYAPNLTPENPMKEYLKCQAKFTPEQVEHWLFHALLHDTDGELIGKRLAEERGPLARWSMQTSQAVDIIRGGDKVNALPETITATVNYRIAPHESLLIVKRRIAKLLAPIAQKHNISFRNFPELGFDDGSSSANTSVGFLSLSSANDLSPSPITPTSTSERVWYLFSSTIRQVFENTTTLPDKTVVPVGDIMQGNTDTIHYWNLTRNIYRFSPAREGTRDGIHTIDEHVEMVAHVEGMRFYYDTILNFDKTDLNEQIRDASHPVVASLPRTSSMFPSPAQCKEAVSRMWLSFSRALWPGAFIIQESLVKCDAIEKS